MGSNGTIRFDRGWFKSAAVLITLVASQVAAAQCDPGTIVGTVSHVRDGDTIELDGLPIRLQGLAAPERGEPGGDAASVAMRTLVLGRRLRCELDGERTRDRCVAVCYLDDCRDIAEVMVRRGLARDCPRFSGGRYAAAER